MLVPVVGLVPNFSPMPRIAPPPLGSERLGIAVGPFGGPDAPMGGDDCWFDVEGRSLAIVGGAEFSIAEPRAVAARARDSGSLPLIGVQGFVHGYGRSQSFELTGALISWLPNDR